MLDRSFYLREARSHVRARRFGQIALALWCAACVPAAAAEFDPGISITRVPGTPCGGGGVVIGDGCTSIDYTGQAQIDFYAQGLLGGRNSQDIPEGVLAVGQEGGSFFNWLRVTLRDLGDRGDKNRITTTINGAEVSWTVPRGENGNLRDYEFFYDRPIRLTHFLIETGDPEAGVYDAYTASAVAECRPKD